MNHEVTIGIPVYNAEKFIRQALESALAQTFESLEFLVLDDCGTDSSMDIVREYQQKHPRGKDIRIVRQPHNMGIGAARNRMIDEAQGRFIYFMDSDDTIEPNTIELLCSAAHQYHAELVYGSYERIEAFDETERRIPSRYPSLQFLKDDAFANYVYRQYDGIQAMIWNILIDIDVYRKNHLRHQCINYWEDFTFTMDLPTYVTRVVLLPNITYHYYCRYGSLSRFGKREFIQKGEILQTMQAVTQIKKDSERIKDKPYFSNRMLKVMKTCFYVCCTILRNREKIEPGFDNKELRDIMRYPVQWSAVRSFSHVPLFVLGKLPPLMSVCLMYMIGKLKQLV